MRCQCKKYYNTSIENEILIRNYLYNDGFMLNYSIWTNNGKTVLQIVNVQNNPTIGSTSNTGSFGVSSSNMVPIVETHHE